MSTHEGLKRINEETWIFSEFPIGPSDNNMYTISRGRKIKSSKFRQWEDEVDIWILKHSKELRYAMNEIEFERPLSLKIVLPLSRQRVYTKDGSVKKMDASNRLKAMQDKVASMLNIDDSLFFRSSIEKWVSEVDRGALVVLTYYREHDYLRKDQNEHSKTMGNTAQRSNGTPPEQISECDLY